MQLTINVNLDNDSFNDPIEIDRVLEQVSKRLSHRGYEHEHTFVLRDSNGNTVGSCCVTQTEEVTQQ